MVTSRPKSATCTSVRALGLALALASFCCGLTGAASASTIALSLTGTFDDGGTVASGSSFTWETSSGGGLANSGLSITTTAGPILPGAIYNSATAFGVGTVVPDGFIVETYGFEGTTSALVAVLSIEFKNAPSTSGPDPIVVGPYSYECFAFACTNGGPSEPSNTASYDPDFTRYFTGGSASASTAATPLPAALPLFVTGLGALGLLGWRRKRKASVAIAA